MSSNFSRLSGSPCYVLTPYTSENSSTYYPVTFTTCVITAVLAPVTVTGNALILAAIWKNPSLRTPSYVLLAGLAVTDFCTGLLTQPAYILSLVSVLTGNRKMRCITAPVSNGLGYYFSALTFTLIVMTAVERWLHMSRRSLLTVRRIVIFCVTCTVGFIPFVAGGMYNLYFWNELVVEIAISFFSAAAECFKSYGAISNKYKN